MDNPRLTDILQGVPETNQAAMKPLDHLNQAHLRAAQGWLELSNIVEASGELDRITASMRAHPDVLEVRGRIYSEAEKWDAVLDTSSALLKSDWDRPSGWLQRSYALHELKRTQEAYEALHPAADKFPNEWIFSFNLACYCAQLGRLEECKGWFMRAMVQDAKAVQNAALDDPDLKPLRDSMAGATWQRVPPP